MFQHLSHIDRTSKNGFFVYQGDGTGRDAHVVFSNGGHEKGQIRTFVHGFQPRNKGFDLSPMKSRVKAAPSKEATAFDYPPDGSGRDLYVIRSQGLKREYQSKHSVFENYLRTDEPTPYMNAKI